MSILIVDDEESNRELLQAILEGEGYDVISAASAQESFDILKREDSDVDLILMDIHMPKIDGVDACRRIKETDRLHDIPIIMVTAITAVDQLRAAFAAGAIDYITKPVNIVEIIARVSSALRLKREMDQRKAHEEELELKNRQMEEAISKIKLLEGLIPICTYCKKVRDDEGYRQNLEDYIVEHSEATFNHCICDECAKKHYPEYYEKVKMREENKK